MVTTTCNNCGGEHHWHWIEAFDKFGFNGGDGQIETWQVEAVLTQAGYSVEVQAWGMHNTMITSIKKDGQELIPHDNPDYQFGYDDPRMYFPAELVIFLNRELPSLSDYIM